MTLSAKRKIELRNYFRIARDVLGDEILKSPNESVSFYRSIRRAVASENHGPDWDEGMEFLKKLTLACARHYRFDMPRLKVAYSWLEGGIAARVSMRADIWYIEVDDKYCVDDIRQMVIVAHEMAHVVLDKKRVRLKPTLRNEELTDTVAVLAGFGNVFEKVCSTKEQFESDCGTKTITQTQSMGYLKRADIQYLLSIKKKLLGHTAVKRWAAIKADGSEDLRCLVCDALIRVPNRKGVFNVLCSVCGGRQVARLGDIYNGSSKLLHYAERFGLQPFLRIGDWIRILR